MITYSETQDGKEVLALIKASKIRWGIKTVDVAEALNIKSQRAAYILNKLADEHKVTRVKEPGERGVRWMTRGRVKVKTDRVSPIQEFDNCLRHLR